MLCKCCGTSLNCLTTDKRRTSIPFEMNTTARDRARQCCDIVVAIRIEALHNMEELPGKERLLAMPQAEAPRG
jgi:hypothetical protein